MPKVTFVFEDDKLSWATQAWADMDAEDQALARKAWAAAEDEEKREPSECGELCENAAIRQRMQQYMLHKLKWTHRELHDALVTAGMSIPLRPSLANYFAALRVQFADPQAGFLPQCFHSHTKKKMQDILRIFRPVGWSRWARCCGESALDAPSRQSGRVRRARRRAHGRLRATPARSKQ